MKKNIFKFVPILLLFLSAAVVSHGESLQSKLAGHLVKLDKENGTLVSAELNPNVKYVALYFSAHWCPPCRQFTPKLVAFYNSLSDADKANFEIVFTSFDKSEDKMIGYMTEYDMQWLATQYKDAVVEDYCGQGIPTLVLLNAETGEVISDSYEANGDYRSPYPVLEDIKKLLKK